MLPAAASALKCGVRSTITPSQKVHALRRAGVRHAPTSIAWNFTHSPNNCTCHGLDWSLANLVFFFFFKIHNSISYRCNVHLHLARPCGRSTLTKSLLQRLLSDSALLVRWISPPFFRSLPLISPLPTHHPMSLINAARSPPIALHPFTTPLPLRHRTATVQVIIVSTFKKKVDSPPSFESRLACLNQKGAGDVCGVGTGVPPQSSVARRVSLLF